MTYRWLHDLDAAVAHLDPLEVPASSIDPTGATSWANRGRPASTGEFDVAGVLCHHTASPAGTSTQSDLNVILAGNSSAPGPISQLYISRDARLHLVAAGRANHGGKGRRPGVDVGGCADMNAHLLGIEVANDGMGERWPDAQVQLYAATVAALCSWYGWPLEAVYLHATTGPPSGGCNSKIDPAGPWLLQPDLPGGGAGTWSLEVWRSYCATFTAGPSPTPPPIGADTVAKCIVHVDESQPVDSPGYWRYNAVWYWAGAWRYHLPSELAVRQGVYESTGDAEVWTTDLGTIVRTPEWVQRVGSLEGYGAVAGADPGDV